MPQLYLVTGLWYDTEERFADSVTADSPEQAEAAILEKYTGENGVHPDAVLIIAGVVTLSAKGEMMVVA